MIAVRPKKFKSCLTSGIPSGESFFMTYPPAQLYVYQNIYFLFQTKKKTKHTHRNKKQKKLRKIEKKKEIKRRKESIKCCC